MMLSVTLQIILITIVPVISKKTDRSVMGVTVTAGETAILPCTAEDAEHLMVIWMNPRKIIISQKESRFIDDTRMSVERPFLGDWNLHIRRVEYKDRGVYTCTINSLPVVVRHINLTVQVPSMIIDRLSTSDVRVREGETVKIVCNATGKPTPMITWYRETNTNGQGKEQVGDVGEELIIYNISRKCGGIYSCKAYNNVPPAVTRPIKVEVQFKPEIELRNKRIGQYREKEMILECIITASPQGINVWKRGSRDIKMEDHWNYRIEVYTDQPYTVYLRLYIVSLDIRDFGRYTCEARNTLGVTRDSMEIYEYLDPTTTTTSTTTSTQLITTRRTTKYDKSTQGYDKMVKGEDALFVSDGQIIDKNKKHNLKETVTKKSSLYKQNNIKTGLIGTGSIDINMGSRSHYSSNILLLLTLTLIWTSCTFS